jgi:hypothetical protein
MFRFARILTSALFVALSSVAILAQSNAAASSTRQKFDHKQKITTRYNKSADATAVRLLLKEPNRLATLAAGGTYPNVNSEFGEDVAISVFFSHPGKQILQPVEEANIWVVYTGGARTAVRSMLSAVVDGRQVMLSRDLFAPVNPNLRNGARVNSLSLSVTRDQLTQLANGSEVVLELPSGERLTLTRQQRNALSDLTSRMSP